MLEFKGIEITCGGAEVEKAPTGMLRPDIVCSLGIGPPGYSYLVPIVRCFLSGSLEPTALFRRTLNFGPQS
jgi:hypothetical protein